MADKQLENVYYTLGKLLSGSFQGPGKLYQALKRKGIKNVTLSE